MNLWKQFQSLLPDERVLIGKVLEHNADGTSSVELPGARVIQVQGQTVAEGSNAFIQHGRVQGEAPDLPIVNIPI